MSGRRWTYYLGMVYLFSERLGCNTFWKFPATKKKKKKKKDIHNGLFFNFLKKYHLIKNQMIKIYIRNWEEEQLDNILEKKK